MNRHITLVVAAMAAGWTFSAPADDEQPELSPLTPEDSGWRISVGVRTAPNLKTKSRVNGAAAVEKAGRVQAVSAGQAPAKGGTKTETSVSETTEDEGTESTGTSKAAAKAASGYKEGVTRYDFDDGYIDLDDAAGVPGETTNWHFDSADSFDASALTVSGSKSYDETKKTKKKAKKTKKTKKTETQVSDGAARTSLRETFEEDPASSGDDSATGFELQIGRTVYRDGAFGVEANVGMTVYKDVDCFEVGGRVYTGHASASRASTQTTTTTTTQTDVTETTTTTTESGTIATVISQPEFTVLDDIQNPDGSIGGASYDGLPTQPGWATPVLTVTSDRFSVVDRPGESTTQSESSTTEGTPKTTTSTSRSPAASVSRTRTVDVYSRGELSLQELRLGVSPFWEPSDWLRFRADLGVIGSYAEVDLNTRIVADGATVSETRHTNDDWNLQGYAGVSVAVQPIDWLELAVGAEARFPKRRIRFDDGIVSGSTELSDWDAFVSIGIRF